MELAGGRLTAEDFLGLSLAVDLVVLGSCESGLSDRRP
ncbi:CHAT domain-containing protein [Streptomyces sp. NBC_00151]|nr:CHAT domain-containing protein [Streptomyces sp. NBC_00151]WRZ44900.1 CHAT domain-containing protein [Streptomyces sp. NBC_00151]